MREVNYQKIVEKRILSLKDGEIFFLEYFIEVVPDRNTIRVILYRLVEKGLIKRLAQGIFTKPKFSQLLNRSIIPDADQIAHAIARRDKARIIYAGNMALNILGLTTQVPMKVAYYTDGYPRKITLYDSREVIFKVGSPKLFSYKHESIQLVVIGLKQIGKRRLEDFENNRIQFSLRAIDPVMYAEDRALIPDWIDKILLPMISEEDR